jgi:hypothetical protein
VLADVMLLAVLGAVANAADAFLDFVHDSFL